MKQRNRILFFALLINQLLVAQNCKIYCSNFNLNRRFILPSGSEKLNDDIHFIAEVKSLNFFEELSKECSKQKEIQIDSLNFFISNERVIYNSLACLLIKDSLNEFVVYNDEFFEYNSKFYRMDCEIYNLYIDLIPVFHIYSATPRYIIKKKCKKFKRIKKIYFFSLDQ
jgi:hypothetical protein